MTPAELIAKLEAATEGAAELDGLIFAWTLGRGPDDINTLCAAPDDHCCVVDHRWTPAPRYTRNLDAALTLVPQHHCWEVRQAIGCRATVWCLEHDYSEGGRPVPDGHTMEAPALALCIAALKALEASRG